MTDLTKPVSRVTRKVYRDRRVIVTLAPAGSEKEAVIGLRLQGERTQYVIALSDVYRIAAVWHGQKEKAARRKAKINGIPWRTAKKEFEASLRI